MCTFILAWRVFADTPIVVAATRDEQLDRPSLPPKVLDEDPLVVAPQDEVAGGTWIGYNERGVVAAITNRWTDASLAGERSRGLLVREALARDSAVAATAFVEQQVQEYEYAGFNLVVVDHNSAVLLEWDGDLRVTEFDPGIHIVVNVGADNSFEIPTFQDAPSELRLEWRQAAKAQAENVRNARDVLQLEDGEPAGDWLRRAKDILRDHDFGFCVHRNGFGTRSASLIRITTDGDTVYEFAEGAPCESGVEFERVVIPT